jgi:hypothetical protein
MNDEFESMEEECVKVLAYDRNHQYSSQIKENQGNIQSTQIPADFRIEYPFNTLRHVTAVLTCSTVTFKPAFSYDLEQTVEDKVPK